uniref:Vesicle transport protein GOT1B n=1 Tax=Knipowitschia caucasica TaxID=637954 RepID=A0AAV2IYP6_KNICA
MISLTDSQKIGMGLTGFGVFFLFFGMILFFDKALLAIGNVLFVVGLAFVIGLERTFRFFFQRHKLKASSFFLGGVLIVLIGWPIVGVLLETYGFFLLFRGFFPVVVGFIRRIPVLGALLNLPFIRSYVDAVGESSSMVSKELTWSTITVFLAVSYGPKRTPLPKGAKTQDKFPALGPQTPDPRPAPESGFRTRQNDRFEEDRSHVCPDGTPAVCVLLLLRAQGKLLLPLLLLLLEVVVMVEVV